MSELLLSLPLLASHLSPKEYSKTYYHRGEFIYLPTDRLDRLFILNQGAVKLGSYSSKGTEVTYDIVYPGEFFGNLQYLPGNVFSEFAKALSPVEVYSYSTPLFKELIQQNTRVAERFHEVMVRRWCRAEAKLLANASLSPTNRVQQLLQQYQQKVTTDTRKSVPIHALLTQKDIANLTGLTRQTVAQIMKNMHVKAV
ncbi:MAG: Crp/Fnr family transcriptional regulator [Bacteroidota bacterium]